MIDLIKKKFTLHHYVSFKSGPDFLLPDGCFKGKHTGPVFWCSVLSWDLQRRTPPATPLLLWKAVSVTSLPIPSLGRPNVCVTVTHKGGMDGGAGSWLSPGLVMITTTIWARKQLMQDQVSPSVSNKQLLKIKLNICPELSIKLICSYNKDRELGRKQTSKW